MRLRNILTPLLVLVDVADATRPPGKISLDDKDAFLTNLISQMSVEELTYQLVLFSGNHLVGPKSDNGLYDDAMQLAPDASLGVVYNWYPTNASQYNSLQAMNLEKSRHKIPVMAMGECLHTIASYRQTVFPQPLALSNSFDTRLAHHVGLALGAEARAIGIHSCYSPVLDIAKEPRWGRNQENWGEDFVLTSHMGVAHALGLSRNGTLSDKNAVAAVVKHFAAHGSPARGINCNSFTGRGRRELLSELLVPFKAAHELGGIKGMMMAYTAIDDVPASLNPFLYKQLEDWAFDGLVMSDWGGLEETMTGHGITTSPADAIGQWLNIGGGIFLYDFTAEIIVNTTIDLVRNGTVELSTLQKRVQRVLDVKYDLGLFHDPYLVEDVDPQALTNSHVPLALESARKSIVLLENRNSTLPLQPSKQGIGKIAVVGPFTDTFNFGGYSGTWGANPASNASTIRQGILGYLGDSNTALVSAWGANSWQYNGQYPIPGYLLSADGTPGGLQATYFRDTGFQDAAFKIFEIPNRDWGLYPPNGLPSNNFSAVWEGEVEIPASSPVNGFIGVAVSANSSARLYIDGQLAGRSPASEAGTILPEIEPYTFIIANSTIHPPGASEFLFQPGARHRIRIEYQTWLLGSQRKISGINSHVQLWWNQVDTKNAVGQATKVVSEADLVVLAVGAAWNSEGENGDRATLTLSDDQTELAQAVFAIGKPVVLVLEGGRPFAIPDLYKQSAAVLSTSFLGQASGQAIADVLFGTVNPAGRLTMSVPYDAAALPSFYNQRINKPTQHRPPYLDIPTEPLYSFGYGLSYTTFSVKLDGAKALHRNSHKKGVFSHGDTITFLVSITNNGTAAGTHVPQIYLLRRAGSSVTMATKQLVAFDSVDVDAGHTATATLHLEVDRYLPTIDREYERVLEAGEYTFSLESDGSLDAATHGNVTLKVEDSYKY